MKVEPASLHAHQWCAETQVPHEGRGLGYKYIVIDTEEGRNKHQTLRWEESADTDICLSRSIISQDSAICWQGEKSLLRCSAEFPTKATQVMEAVEEGRCGVLPTQQAPPGGEQRHRFRLHYWVHDGVHPQGARLAVLGSGQALGDWRPEGAVLGKEIPARSGWWEVDTALPPGDRVEFKFAVVLKESETSVLRWEWRGNRELVVLPDTVQASVHALWDYGQYVDVQIARECPREVVSERGVGDHASLEEKPAGGSTSTSDPASSTLPSDTPPSPQSQEADSSGSNLARLQTQPRTSGAISWPKTEMEFRAHFPTPTQSALALIGNLPELGCWGRQGVVPAVPESEDWWSVRLAVPVDTPYQYSWLVLDPATGVATHTESVLRNRWTPPPGKSTVEEIVRLEFLPQSFKDLSLPLSHPEARYDQTQGGISLLPIEGFVSQLVGQSFSLERSSDPQVASEPVPVESPQGIPLDILQHTSVETIHDSGIYHDEGDSLEAHIEPVQASAFSAKPKEGYIHVIKSENVDLLGAEAPGHEIKSENVDLLGAEAPGHVIKREDVDLLGAEAPGHVIKRENVDLLGAEAPGHVIKRENVDLLGAEAPGHVIKSKGVDLLGGEGSQDATTNTDVVATQSVRLGTTPLKTSTSGTMTPIRKTSESATMPDITEQREKATNTTMSGQKEASPAQKEAHAKSFTSTGSDPIFPYPCVEANNAEIKQASSNPVVTLLLGLVALSATATAVYFALSDDCEEQQGRERSVTGRTDL